MSELKGILTERETLIGTLSLGADYYKGETGDSGVYVGAGQPTNEDINIWIEPDGEATNNLVSKEEFEKALENIEVPLPDLSDYAKAEDIPDVSGFQTAEQVETAITQALNKIGVAEEGAY